MIFLLLFVSRLKELAEVSNIIKQLEREEFQEEVIEKSEKALRFQLGEVVSSTVGTILDIRDNAKQAGQRILDQFRKQRPDSLLSVDSSNSLISEDHL